MATALLLGGLLGGCTFGAEALLDNPAQPYPVNYRTEMLSFMRTYLNDPRGIREAAISEPLQRTVGGRLRYVACVRYNARETGAGYPGAKDRAVLYIDGRLDRLIEDGREICSGVSYQPFPDLEKLSRPAPER